MSEDMRMFLDIVGRMIIPLLIGLTIGHFIHGASTPMETISNGLIIVPFVIFVYFMTILIIAPIARRLIK